MSPPDQSTRNRRGCFLVIAIVAAVLAIFIFMFFSAPTSERERSISNGQAPIGTSN